MADCEWAILCDYAFQDVNRKMCMIGAFNQISTTSVPAVHALAALVLKVSGDANEKVSIRVEIVRPSGGLLVKVEGEVQLGIVGAGEINLQLNQLPLPDWGLYSFNIFVADQLSKTIGFNLLKIESTKP
ncbi:MAG: hypothetical protein AB7R67_20235 [Vicinamibacterales bacterium]